MLELDRAVLARLQNVCRLGASISSKLLSILKHVLDVPDCSTLAYNYVVTVDNGTWVDNAIVVQLVIGTMAHVLSLSEVRSLKDLILVLSVRVSSEEGRAE